MFPQLRDPLRSGRGCLICFLAVVMLAGCSSRRHRGWFKARKTSADWLDLALEAECPDDRRAGVTGLAESRDAMTPWAIKVFDTIARTDTDVMVRCAAVRALRPSAGPDRVPTLLKLLDSASNRVETVRPAPAPVRHETAKLLHFIVDSRAYDDSQQDAIVEAWLDRLAKDDDRNVRLTSIEALAYFPLPPVPPALVDAMQEDDYAIKHAAERALAALTGHTHGHDAVAWRQWLAAADDPFKDAGAISPEALEVKKKPWWKRRWEW